MHPRPSALSILPSPFHSTLSHSQSAIDPAFWARLGERKLDEWGLSEAPVPITGFLGASTHAGVPAPLTLDARSLDPASRPPADLAPVPGTLWLVNSLARFKAFDRAGAVAAAASATAAAIAAAPSPLHLDPAALGARFVLLAHADLKAYKFTYWRAVPALTPSSPWVGLPVVQGGPSPPPLSVSLAAAAGSASAAAAITAACDGWRGVGRPSGGHQAHHPPAWLVTPPPPDGGAASCAPLEAWPGEDGASTTTAPTQQPWLAFDDPSGDPAAPGWPLRNLLAAVSSDVSPLFVPPRRRPETLTILAVRPAAAGRVCPTASRVLRVALPPPAAAPPPPSSSSPTPPPPPPHVAGWELNAKGRPGPRQASLAGALDPATLAADALALNLRLMRWRAAPGLPLAAISSARFLLLGAGTLGCGAARALLGWGATRVTLVDCGRVAFSNPPRQPLFEHGDCLGGGAPKAGAAAAALKRIFPGSEAVGVDLAIPMPGHLAPRAEGDPGSASAWAEAEAGVGRLQELVGAADVVMLLTDTRESRWLPSLLCAASEAPPKLAVTAALGFDTFVVMRHGVRDAPTRETHGVHDAQDTPAAVAAPPPVRLGCYFCSDVVAPGDSTADRALDQQCTVARPGLAPIASALAVELAAAVLAHPAGPAAPPPADDALASSLPLGPAPHMLRGRLGGGFSQVPMVGPASAVCTACSPPVVAAFKAGGVAWVLQALSDRAVLEGVAGLTALHAAMDAREVEGEEGSEGAAAPLGGGSGGEEEEEEWTEL